MTVTESSRAIFSHAFNWAPVPDRAAVPAGAARAAAATAAFDAPVAPGRGSATIKPPPTAAGALRKSRRLRSEAGLTSVCPNRAVPLRGEWPCGFLDRYRIGKYYRTSPHRYRHRWALDAS